MREITKSVFLNQPTKTELGFDIKYSSSKIDVVNKQVITKNNTPALGYASALIKLPPSYF